MNLCCFFFAAFYLLPLIFTVSFLLERAKAVWAKVDVDDIFDAVLEKLDHLKKVLKKKTATDKGWTSSVVAKM